MASAGLKVVASFLERLVSLTEMAMEDVTVLIECPHPSEDDRVIALTLHIHSLTYSDIPHLLRPQPPSPVSPPSSSSPSPSLFSPTFSYRKRVAVHGFRVTLSEPLKDSTGAEDDEGGKERTIAHADVDQQCEVRLNVDINGGGVGSSSADTPTPPSSARATVDASVHLRTLRGLLTPRQLQLLGRVGQAVKEGSFNAAKGVVDANKAEEAKDEEERGGRGSEDGDRSHRRRRRRQSAASDGDSGGVRGSQGSHSTSAKAGSSSAFSFSSSSAVPSVPLWRLAVNVAFASLMVLEEEEAVRSEWWLEPVLVPSSDCPSPSTLLSPLISNISVDHLLLSVQAAHLLVSQTSTQSSATLTLGRLSVFEYLQQYRLMISTLPSLSSSASTATSPPQYEEQQQRMGFSARRLLRLGLGEKGEEAEEAEGEGEDSSVGGHSHAPPLPL